MGVAPKEEIRELLHRLDVEVVDPECYIESWSTSIDEGIENYEVEGKGK